MSTSTRRAPARTATRRRRRTKKRALPPLYIVSVLVLLTAIIAALFAMQHSYDRFLRSAFELEHYDTVMQASSDFDVPAALIYGVIRTESGFDERAHSSADAMGLMQVTETTLSWLHLRSDEFDAVTVNDLYDPVINIRCGTYMLHLLMERYAVTDTVLAAYNAGLGNVDEWLQDPAYSDDGHTLHTIPYRETRDYVERVNTSRAIYEHYYHLNDPKGES